MNFANASIGVRLTIYICDIIKPKAEKVMKKMARRQRVHYRNAFYHVIARGNNHTHVLNQEQDKREYLILTDKYLKKYGARLYAYVIMDNHVHLLIQVGEEPLSKVMQLIQQTYTAYYNRKYKQSGHVFEQRYKAILCEKDAYLLLLIRYIHQNPLRAGIGNLDYSWSSHKEYATGTRGRCEVDEVLQMLSGDKGKAVVQYMDFVSELDEEVKAKKDFEFEPDEIILENISIDLEKRSIEEVISDFENRTGYGLEVIMQKYASQSIQVLKAQLIKEIVRTTHMNQKKLADYFKVNEMTISRYMNQK